MRTRSSDVAYQTGVHDNPDQRKFLKELCHDIYLAPVVQKLDSAIHRINHYPGNKYYGNQLRYPLDSDLSGG